MPVVDTELTGLQRPAAHGAPLPCALALGCVGALGEELLAQLVGGTGLSAVYVGVEQPIGSAAARYRPWVIGHGVIVVQQAYVCLTDDTTFVPAATPVRRYREPDLLDAANLARQCGATQLTVVAPLSALLQMNAAARVLAPQAEVALRSLGFERLLIVRPTAADPIAGPGGVQGLIAGAARAVADIMLPGYARALSARTAARAIVAAAAGAPRGVTVLGARELLQVLEARLPQLAPTKRRWW
jgi:hypothetical protein